MLMNIMDNSMLQYIGIDPAFYFLGIVVLLFVFIIILIVQQCKIKKLRKRLDVFMSGKESKSLEEEFQERFREIDTVKEALLHHTSAIKEVGESFKVSYSKMGIVKYDAFKEMGGNMSFALCLLTEKNDGMLLNSMHSREGCYTYIKEIVDGKSYIELSEEEQEALTNAVNTRNYMTK